jgi:hypothetical protein
MLPRVEYSVTARAAPEELWAAFSDLSRLLGRGIYSEAAWTQGEPWRTGSRLRYVVVQPLEAIVSAVVTHSEPPLKVGLLNHALGVTVQQMVVFTRLKDSTRVDLVMDALGQSTAPASFNVEQALDFFAKDALDTMLARWRVKQKTP